ncbi:hypothetical protein CW703_01575 [Candidatus Bathyarchaeota archaeon]|nr:MAG: hypothetical protein CW703_01575 [Candidatus Bathyarchaeota archaeon]
MFRKRTLKLDLHTHPFEAMGFPQPTLETVGRIVKMVKRKGIDGIAITEHENKDYGFKAAQIASKHFNDILILPGWEITLPGEGSEISRQVVEIFIDEKIFRFQAHPIVEKTEILKQCHGIEVYNLLHKDELNQNFAERLAKKYGLIPLTNSDAHSLEKIGNCYNEISIEDLIRQIEKFRFSKKDSLD